MAQPNATPDAGAPLGPPDRPRVLVTLVVSTNQPEPQKFILATLDKWLRTNAKRPNVPYEIFVAPTPWRQEVATGGMANAPATPPAPVPMSVTTPDSGKSSLESIAPIAALRPAAPDGLPPATTFTITFTASKLPPQQPEAKP